MERRELLSLGGIAAIAGAFGGGMEREEPASRQTHPTHLCRRRRQFAHPGTAHRYQARQNSPDRIAPVTGFSLRRLHGEFRRGLASDARRQFSISMSGEIEVEVSDGKKHAIHAGDIVFLEDLQGKGHITRILSPVTNIFIRVADGFDVVKWSRGEA